MKNYQTVFEHALLAQPIMEHIAPQRAPLVLDVATGTGRLPLALFGYAHFHGRVVAVDLSRRMLHHAALKLQNSQDRQSLIWCPAETLPFPDDTFDVVTCLESLEFMIDPSAVLVEMMRVLRPGGLLLISNRANTRLMPGKVWSKDQLTALLSELEIDDAYIEPWQIDYQRVWAIRSGDALPSGPRPLGEILRCPCCLNAPMTEGIGVWVCEHCGGEAAIGADGVIELFRLQESC